MVSCILYSEFYKLSKANLWNSHYYVTEQHKLPISKTKLPFSGIYFLSIWRNLRHVLTNKFGLKNGKISETVR